LASSCGGQLHACALRARADSRARARHVRDLHPTTCARGRRRLAWARCAGGARTRVGASRASAHACKAEGRRRPALCCSPVCGCMRRFSLTLA